MSVLLLLLVSTVVFGLGCEATDGAPTAARMGLAPHVEPIERPGFCVDVAAGENLQARLDSLVDGGALCLAAGRHLGPIEIKRRIVLWGPRQARVVTERAGTVIALTGVGAQVLGITVDGRGGRYDMQDAAIAIRADEVQVRGVRIENAVFGILSDRVSHLVISDNAISGVADVPLGVRGDGIRLWETRDSLVARNHLWDGRDMVVWYSPGNRFEDNLSEGGRYGTHFMHSSDNLVKRGRFVSNVVGVFVMYSHDIRVEDSDFVDCASAGGMGVGIKDSGNVTVVRNRFIHVANGLYLDNSPGTRAERNVISHNTFRLNEAAVVFHASSAGNTLTRNVFASNRDQVTVEGGGDAIAARWLGNAFDDYAGYDFDGDGLGDVAYEVRSLSSSLGSRFPALGFFRGSVALGVVEALGRMIPLFAPRTLMVDRAPRMGMTLGAVP